MTQQHRTALKELQKLDTRIQDARHRIAEFDPRFEEAEEPALVLEGELNTTRNRLKDMKLEERRLESSTEDRRDRLRRLEERLGSVRNLREEAAVSAELDMVRRALQNDEQEALGLVDQLGKAENRLVDLEEAYAEALRVVEPLREALLAEREAAKGELQRLEAERSAFAEGMNPDELRLYNSIRGGGRRAAIAELTDDGACGNCYGVVPLQHQNEVRHGQSIIRCEACGVILAAPEPGSAGEVVAAPAEESAAPEPELEADAPGVEDGGSEEE
jgi:predicted  nucleic acid-binding Zn-ribbon protein